jgi:hypothetical protein
MKFSLRRASIAVAVLALGAISIAWLRREPRASSEVSRIVHPVRRAAFTKSITTTGELRARKFVTIMGPSSQMAEIFQTKISWMVPEGTAVKEGDRVAELDAAPAATRLQSVKLDLQRAEADFTNAELDSAMALSQAREDLRTAEYLLEERTLGKQQAVYEAPTVKRKAEIDYDRALRAFEAAKRTLDVKTQQSIAKISIAATNVERRRNSLKAVEDAIGEFTIYAPQDGLVIYLREYGGRRKGIGSLYYPWDPSVATLPDLTAMQSQTYVNEVDIRSVAIGQNVRITLDAEPGKRLNGRVISVANVGEQRLGQDAKVFEVVIDIAEADTTLRPSMTTANAIEIGTTANALTIPVSAIVTEGGKSFVHVRDGSEIVKQAIELGGADHLNAVVTRGLSENDEVVTRLLPTEVVARTRPLPTGAVSAAPRKQ